MCDRESFAKIRDATEAARDETAAKTNEVTVTIIRK